MDLSFIQDLPDAEFEILHPITGKGTGNFFRLLGPQHPLRKTLYTEIGADVVARLQGSTPQAVAEEKDLEFLCRCVTGWRYQNPEKGKEDDKGEYIRWNGGSLIHTPAAVRNIFENPKYQWLPKQIDVYLGKRERFIQDSSPTSVAGTTGVCASTGPSPATASTPPAAESSNLPSASPA